MLLIATTSNLWGKLPCTPQCTSHAEKINDHPLILPSTNQTPLADATEHAPTYCYNCIALYNTVLTLATLFDHAEADFVTLAVSTHTTITSSYNRIPDPYMSPPA